MVRMGRVAHGKGILQREWLGQRHGSGESVWQRQREGKDNGLSKNLGMDEALGLSLSLAYNWVSSLLASSDPCFSSVGWV